MNAVAGCRNRAGKIARFHMHVGPEPEPWHQLDLFEAFEPTTHVDVAAAVVDEMTQTDRQAPPVVFVCLPGGKT
jgi:hypothetical protein